MIQIIWIFTKIFYRMILSRAEKPGYNHTDRPFNYKEFKSKINTKIKPPKNSTKKAIRDTN